jgi:hypothetical protein
MGENICKLLMQPINIQNLEQLKNLNNIPPQGN